jgi:dTMP kinase
MAGRYKGDEKKKDIHERNVKYLEQSAKAAAYCARKLGWKVVRCSRAGEMRGVTDIRTEIHELLKV